MALAVFGPEFHVRFIINEHVFHAHTEKKNDRKKKFPTRECEIANERQQPIQLTIDDFIHLHANRNSKLNIFNQCVQIARIE